MPIHWRYSSSFAKASYTLMHFGTLTLMGFSACHKVRDQRKKTNNQNRIHFLHTLKREYEVGAFPAYTGPTLLGHENG